MLLACLLFVGTASAQKILFLSLNDKCRDGAEPWFCKKSSDCKGLKEGIKSGAVEICNFSGVDPIVCCPPSPKNTGTEDSNSHPTVSNGTKKGGNLSNRVGSLVPGKKAEEKCREYAKHVYYVIESPLLLPGSEKQKLPDCAVSAETLIVGGSPAKLKEFPHMALIGMETDVDISWFCGGSLISNRFILTAAHCNVSQMIGKAVARLGDLDIFDNRDHARPIDVKIAEVFDHPQYDHSKGYHDISLLKLNHDITLGPGIRPLCLQTSADINREKAVASGWGYTKHNGRPSSSLQKVLLDLVDDDTCKSKYAFERNKLPGGIKPDIMFCAGGVIGKDTCQGDSGGPLQIALKEPFCMYSQIGVTAFGVGCGTNFPGGYTRVSHYVPWIENIVWP